MTQSPNPNPPASRPDAEAAADAHPQDVEQQIYARADEIARLLRQLRGPTRSIVRRTVSEMLRDLGSEPPVPEPAAEPGSREGFGAFGGMILVVGLLFIPVIPSMAVAFLVIGSAILVLSFIASKLSARKNRRDSSRGSLES